MNAYISFELDHTSDHINRTSLEGDENEVRKIAQQVEHANEIWHDFALNSRGEVIFLAGPEGRISIPIDKLEEVGAIARQYAEAMEDTVSVGIGMDLQESIKALIASKLLGGNRNTMYGEQAEKVISEHEQENKLNKNELAMNPAPSALDRFHNMAQMYEQTQMDKEAEMAREREIQQLKVQVVGVLQQLKQAAPQLAQLRQVAPETYQAVSMMAQAMLSLAQELTGINLTPQTQQTSPQATSGSTMAIPAYRAPKAPHADIPVGAIRNGKIKVKVGDTTSWRSVRSGLGVDNEGNPTSIRNVD